MNKKIVKYLHFVWHGHELNDFTKQKKMNKINYEKIHIIYVGIKLLVYRYLYTFMDIYINTISDLFPYITLDKQA